MDERIRLERRTASGVEEVEATLLTRLGAGELRQLDTWGPLLRKRGEPDAEWNWRELLGEAERKRGGAAASAALMLKGRVQGAILFWTSERPSRLDGGSMIYVDRLASAPEHRIRRQGTPRLEGVGSALMGHVREHSRRTGGGGRVGLHSLAASEGFYRRLGMKRMEPEAHDDGFAYFEWPAEEVRWG